MTIGFPVTVAIQQTQRQTKLICADPGAPMIAIDRGNKRHSVHLAHSRTASGLPRVAFVAIAQQHVTFYLTQPAYCAHAASSFQYLRVDGATPKSSPGSISCRRRSIAMSE